MELESTSLYVLDELLDECEIIGAPGAVQERELLGRMRSKHVVKHGSQRGNPSAARDEQDTRMFQ
jgi:hypothetical protein